ncbi:MAG: hypothetical protein ACRDTV_05860 [Mycobacterium sp.]
MMLSDHRPPRPAASAEPAHWLTNRINLWGQHGVTNLVGSGFPAYARLLHPLDGRTIHPSAPWEKISSSRGRTQPGDPHRGTLNTWALEALSDILAAHTTSPQTCYFAVWEGWGWMHDDGSGPSTITAYYAPDGVPPDVQPPEPAPADWQLDLSGPTFSVPGRNYYLFEGHVDDAVRIGHWVHEGFFIPQSPNFFWPADHAWCLATEIDDDSTVIGGSRELVDELCASETIEALRIAPDAPFEDRLNP